MLGGIPWINDRRSFTLTSGVRNRDPSPDVHPLLLPMGLTGQTIRVD